MKKFILLIASLLILGGCAQNTVEREAMTIDSNVSKEIPEKTAEASIMQHFTIESKSLGKSMKVNVYIPQGYTGKEPYSVLYVLHGKNGNENSFFSNGLDMNKRADKLIKAGKIKPVLIVSPQIDNSYGVNSSEETKDKKEYNLGMYEDYLIDELIPIIDNNFNTVKSRGGRYIGGISMGGFAAFHLAFKHQEMFSKVGGHSAAVWREVPEYLTWLYKNEQDQSENDPVLLVGNAKVNDMSIYLDHGDKEHQSIAEGNAALTEQLDKYRLPYEAHFEASGGHNNKYWASQMDNYLIFYAGIK
ncbi:MAG: alpha/beta hydrolase [Candidatus Pristimantibacillus sp.]